MTQKTGHKPASKPPIAKPPHHTLRERLIAQKKTLLAAQEQINRQADGIVNQIYALDQLLNPEPVTPPEAPPEKPPEQPGII